MPKTFLVHGFNVTDGGADTVERIRPYLNEYGSVKAIKYGWFGLLSVIFRNKSVAAKLADEVQKQWYNNFVVGHSNGCAIIVEAMRQGACFDAMLLINPALKPDTVFPEGVKNIYVIHTHHDKPTMTAQILDKIPGIGLIIPNAWGSMGAVGYTGNDPRVENIDMTWHLEGHSDIFSSMNMNMFGPDMAAKLFSKTTVQFI